MSGTGKIINVLIVDDSAFMRKVIGDILSEDPLINVVGRARNGREALRLFDELSPDVITLDIEMPGMNGIEVLKSMMSKKPTPIVMVSGLTKYGADITMQALDNGAVDFVMKPSGTISLDMDKVGDELKKKVLEASRATIQRGAANKPAAGAPAVSAQRREPPKHAELVSIAASTGGPMALQELIPALPANFPVPIVLVQHMPPGFTSSFASRLDERSGLTVVEAEDGMLVRKGMVIVAPGGRHLIIEKKNMSLTCRLTETAPVRSVRPSADVLFNSIADAVIGGVVALVLTGMGKDGLDGTRALREKGAYVIAEAKETCVIYGMPSAVIDAGLADEVLPLYLIAAGLVRVAR
jgi:two-component system chemotaxis response regulator CheB